MREVTFMRYPVTDSVCGQHTRDRRTAELTFTFVIVASVWKQIMRILLSKHIRHCLSLYLKTVRADLLIY